MTMMVLTDGVGSQQTGMSYIRCQVMSTKITVT